ncbi:MAG: acyltransferase family protein, partial [Desulfobacterales bacterium]|nr:acyltransferase family protein [Desulfobacterales bacterium]
MFLPVSGGASLAKAAGRQIAFDYMRAFTVTLVLWHHAILAYTTFAFVNLENPVMTHSPVVNEQRWIGFDLLAALNETFIMPLLYFISGMFVWQSLAKKGIKKYLTGRFTRLGIPFIFGVFFLIPIAYYPAQIQVGLITGTNLSYGEFWLEMIRSGFGTAGPLWFLWLLLTFNALVTLLCHFFPFIQETFRRQLTVVIDRPLRFSIILIGISILVYLPVTIATGPLA